MSDILNTDVGENPVDIRRRNKMCRWLRFTRVRNNNDTRGAGTTSHNWMVAAGSTPAEYTDWSFLYNGVNVIPAANNSFTVNQSGGAGWDQNFTLTIPTLNEINPGKGLWDWFNDGNPVYRIWSLITDYDSGLKWGKQCVTITRGKTVRKVTMYPDIKASPTVEFYIVECEDEQCNIVERYCEDADGNRLDDDAFVAYVAGQTGFEIGELENSFPEIPAEGETPAVSTAAQLKACSQPCLYDWPDLPVSPLNCTPTIYTNYCIREIVDGEPIDTPIDLMVIACANSETGEVTFEYAVYEQGTAATDNPIEIDLPDGATIVDCITGEEWMPPETCSECTPRTTYDAVCHDEEQTIGDVTVEAGFPIIRGIVEPLTLVNGCCVPTGDRVEKFYNFLDPSQQFAEADVTYSAVCDPQTVTTAKICDALGREITVVNITVGLPSGELGTALFYDNNGQLVVPVEPFRPCDPDAEPQKMCVYSIETGEPLATVYQHIIYDELGEVFSTCLTTLRGKPYTLPGGAEVDCCEERCKVTDAPKYSYALGDGGLQPPCDSATITVDGEVIDLCDDESDGMFVTEGDLSLGGIRSVESTSSSRWPVPAVGGYPLPTGDALNAATQITDQAGFGYDTGSSSQWQNLWISADTVGASGSAPSIKFSAEWCTGSGIGVMAYDAATGTFLPVLPAYTAGLSTYGPDAPYNVWNTGSWSSDGPQVVEFDTSSVTDISTVWFVTVVIGAPGDQLKGIQINDATPAPSSCDINTVEDLVTALSNETGLDWFVEDGVLCVFTDKVLGDITCGDTSVLPTITEQTRWVSVSKVTAEKPIAITPQCYKWSDGENSGKFTGYALLNEVGKFKEWCVSSGDAPPAASEASTTPVQAFTLTDTFSETDASKIGTVSTVNPMAIFVTGGITDRLGQTLADIISGAAPYNNLVGDEIFFARVRVTNGNVTPNTDETSWLVFRADDLSFDQTENRWLIQYGNGANGYYSECGKQVDGDFMTANPIGGSVPPVGLVTSAQASQLNLPEWNNAGAVFAAPVDGVAVWAYRCSAGEAAEVIVELCNPAAEAIALLTEKICLLIGEKEAKNG